MKRSVPLLIVLLVAPIATLIAESLCDTAWQALDGTDKEKGDAVRIVKVTGENLEVP